MDTEKRSLPKNAYTPLAPGEKYIPLLPANEKPREVTFYSVAWGLFFSVLFSAAAAYLGLKIGQVFEADIPIAIIAVHPQARREFLAHLLRLHVRRLPRHFIPDSIPPILRARNARRAAVS